MLTDHHSHILPGIDDGAKTVEISVKMIRSLKAQGVRRIVATPHFYAHRERSLERFLEKRQQAYDKMMRPNIYMNNIILGAEVAVERGISEIKGIQKLAYQGTNYILLEFPYTGFQDWMIEEVENIAFNYRLKPIIAHLHRYLDDYSKSQIDAVLSMNAVFQFNNEAFTSWSSKRLLKKVMDSGRPFVFGSDCHNLRSRKPNFDLLIKKAKIEWIEKSNRLLDKPKLNKPNK